MKSLCWSKQQYTKMEPQTKKNLWKYFYSIKQSVLYTARQYYSKKYHYCSESIYERGSRNGYCLLWNKTDNRRGFNKIYLAINIYLNELNKKRFPNNISLLCNSCSGHTWNRAFISTIAFFLKSAVFISSNKVIFLLPGQLILSKLNDLLQNGQLQLSGRCIEFSKFR